MTEDLTERFGDLMLKVLKTIEQTYAQHGSSADLEGLLQRIVASSKSFTVLSAARGRKVPLSAEHLDQWEADLQAERHRLGLGN